MKVYLVIGAFGDGGITTAMFNRAAMLNDAGHGESCSPPSVDGPASEVVSDPIEQDILRNTRV